MKVQEHPIPLTVVFCDNTGPYTFHFSSGIGSYWWAISHRGPFFRYRAEKKDELLNLIKKDFPEAKAKTFVSRTSAYAEITKWLEERNY